MKKQSDEMQRLADLWRKYITKRDECLNNYRLVKEKMEYAYLTISELAEVLDLNPTQLLNWSTQVFGHGIKKEKKEASWHKYSIFDALCFAILKSQKSIGIPLKKSIHVFHWLQKLLREPVVLTDFSHGKELLIICDDNNDNVTIFHLPEHKEQLYSSLAKIMTSITIIPLSPIIRTVLEKTNFSEFDSEIGKDNNVVYLINGNPVRLPDIPQEPAELKANE